MMKNINVSVIIGTRESLPQTGSERLMYEEPTDNPESFYAGVFGRVDENTGKFKVNSLINSCRNPFLVSDPDGIDCKHLEIMTVSVPHNQVKSIQANLLENLRENWAAKFDRLDRQSIFGHPLIKPLGDRTMGWLDHCIGQTRFESHEKKSRIVAVAVMDPKPFREGIISTEEWSQLDIDSRFVCEHLRWTQECVKSAYVDKTDWDAGEVFHPKHSVIGTMVMELHGPIVVRDLYVEKFVPGLMRSGAMMHQDITIEDTHRDYDDNSPEEDYTPRPGG